MSEQIFYTIVTIVFIAAAVVIFITLFFITAPYGRHAKSGWGPLISNRLGWVIMEAPASIFFALYAVIGMQRFNATLLAFIAIWQFHYFHRAFIYPFTLRNVRSMPFSIVFFGFLFNVINTYVQGRWIFTFVPENYYTVSWLFDPRFIIGTVIFITGFVINKHADYVLTKLRTPGETGYKIPAGGLYNYISCPNYFGELVEWIGWALLTWSFAGAVFALWTAANLIPRGYAHHQWYRKTFPEYPPSRRAVIPFIF